MSKKIIAIVVIVLVVIGGAAAAYFLMAKPGSESKSSSSASSPEHKKPISSVKACDILTASIAKEILGDTATYTPSGTDDLSTPDYKTTSCSYGTKPEQSTSASLEQINLLSLQVTAPTTQAGVTRNQEIFASQPSSAEDLKGIGDQAFFDSTIKNLQILKGVNMYTLTYFKHGITSASTDDYKLAAGKLQLK